MMTLIALRVFEQEISGISAISKSVILETFPIVKRKDEARYGEYRTKRRVVEALMALRG